MKKEKENEMSQFEMLEWILKDRDISEENKISLIKQILKGAKQAGLETHDYAFVSAWCMKKMLEIFINAHQPR